MQLYTVGHSDRSAEEFLALLRDVAVQGLADVRRFPRSRRYPHFDRDRIAASLEAGGIAYRHFEDLGAFRDERDPSPHVALESAAMRGYADHMATPRFLSALEELESWAKEIPVALMCAEASPRQCHRRFLSDALDAHGFRVWHLLAAERLEPHSPSEEMRRAGGRLIYDVGALFPEVPPAREEGA